MDGRIERLVVKFVNLPTLYLRQRVSKTTFFHTAFYFLAPHVVRGILGLLKVKMRCFFFQYLFQYFYVPFE